MSVIFSRCIAIGLLAIIGAVAHAGSARVDERVSAALRLLPSPSRGQALYEASCAGCHGMDARGDGKRSIPALAGQRQTYLLKQLADFTEIERDSEVMHRVVSRQVLARPQSWADIAAYVSSLEAAQLGERGDGKRLQLGEAIFREQCAACHGDDGRGDREGFVPSLRNQHYSYLLRQMRDIAGWHRRDVEEGLIRFLESLAPDEQEAVADYLARLQGPVPAPNSDQ